MLKATEMASSLYIYLQLYRKNNNRRELVYLISISSVVYELSTSFEDEFNNLTNPLRSTKRLAAVVGFEFNSENISSAVSCFFGTSASPLLWPGKKENNNQLKTIHLLEMENSCEIHFYPYLHNNCIHLHLAYEWKCNSSY